MYLPLSPGSVTHQGTAGLGVLASDESVLALVSGIRTGGHGPVAGEAISALGAARELAGAANGNDQLQVLVLAAELGLYLLDQSPTPIL